MEKLGIPTVTLTTNQFVTLSRSSQSSQGLTDMALVALEHPIGMLPKEEVLAKVDKSFAEILNAAQAWQPAPNDLAGNAAPYPAPRFDYTGTVEDVNALFRTRNWSLHLPIIPPTDAAVANMLTGTKRDPAEVLWVVPPREAVLTVELVATLGVMAGGLPEHMPLLIAAVKAMSDPESGWRSGTTTTAASTPMFVISGPIVERLGLNASTGVLSAQNHPTNVLGYFVNLVGDVVGGSVRPVDMSSQGSVADLVAVVATENTAETPWATTFAEDQGFTKQDSVMTMFDAYPFVANIDHNNTTGAGLLDTLSLSAAGGAAGISSCFVDPSLGRRVENYITFSLMLLAPEHAATIAADFPDKEAVRAYMVKNTVLPFKLYAPDKCTQIPEGFGPVTPDTLLPRYVKNESIQIVVSGGPGKQSQVYPAFAQNLYPISVKIDE